MATRIVLKVGNVYCLEIEGTCKYFLQYVGDDKSQLNSNVIRVFKTRYPLAYVPNLDDIVNDEVMFYAHVILKFGIQDGIWYKVGKHKDVGDLDIYFRLFGYRWYTWKIDGPFHFYDELSPEIEKYDLGWVFRYRDIVRKITTGHYEGWLEFVKT